MPSVIEKRKSVHKELERLRRENETLRSYASHLEPLANLGSATAMIAHELNNLLTPPVNYARLALKNPDDQAYCDKALAKTVSNCERASRVAAGILALAGGEGQEKEQMSLSEVVEEVFGCLCRDFQKDKITVKVEVPDDIRLFAVQSLIEQMLMNLILNARDAMLAQGGTLSVNASASDANVTIEVGDTGKGIAADELTNIFDCFYTTKQGSDGRSGSGLGLALCKRVVDAHNGSITVQSQPGRGTKFVVTVPIAR